MFDHSAAIINRLRAPLRLVLAIALAWIATDALVYRSGAYLFVAEPASNTGAVVTKLLMIERQYVPGARNIVVFGDSRVGEGFSPSIAGDGAEDINFINLAVPGSTPRTWYYLLREIDRRGYRFDAVVVGTLYRDPLTGLRADWPLDPSHAMPLLGLRHVASYPATFASEPLRERARDAVLFPALAMREDTIALLRNPVARARDVFAGRRGFLQAVLTYPGRDETMPSVTFLNGRPVIPATAAPAQRAHIEHALHEATNPPPVSIAEANDAFLGHWLQRMATLSHAQGAEFVVYPLPRGPYREALGDEQPLSHALQRLQTEGVHVLPPDLLAALEAPAFFFDDLHANRPGRERTSAIVGARVRRLLAEDAPR